MEVASSINLNLKPNWYFFYIWDLSGLDNMIKNTKYFFLKKKKGQEG